MKQLDVIKRRDGWAVMSDGRKTAGGATKVEAVHAAAAKAKRASEPVTVKIHNRDGTLQEQRTYRSSEASKDVRTPDATRPQQRRKLVFAGLGSSGHTDTSERVDEILRDEVFPSR
jgi:hypothetical protein